MMEAGYPRLPLVVQCPTCPDRRRNVADATVRRYAVIFRWQGMEPLVSPAQLCGSDGITSKILKIATLIEENTTKH